MRNGVSHCFLDVFKCWKYKRISIYSFVFSLHRKLFLHRFLRHCRSRLQVSQYLNYIFPLLQDESSEEEDDAYEPTDAESEEDSEGSEYDSEASDESDASGDSDG